MKEWSKLSKKKGIKKKLQPRNPRKEEFVLSAVILAIMPQIAPTNRRRNQRGHTKGPTLTKDPTLTIKKEPATLDIRNLFISRISRAENPDRMVLP